LAGDAISRRIRSLETIAPANYSRTAQGERVLEGSDLAGVIRFDEDVRRADDTENGGEEPGTGTAQARDHQYGREQASSEKRAQPNRPESEVEAAR
jgi:hypothetical protein